MSTKVERSIQVDVPVSTAYNQWTQFEDFPHFMGGVKDVHQHDDQRLHWVAEIAGVRREWEATILEQVPDQKIAWAATEGATNAGAVRFEPVGPGATLVYLSMEYEPEGVVEQVGDKLGIVERQVTSDLQRFKDLIEDEGYASGAWRGSVNAGLGVGTPGVEAAAASRGDSGKAGVSPTVVAGCSRGCRRSRGGRGARPSPHRRAARRRRRPSNPRRSPSSRSRPRAPSGTTSCSRSPHRRATPRHPSTEGVEKGVTPDGDDPMIGGGSR